MRTARRIGCLVLALSLVSWSAAATTVRWHDLRSVRVTKSNSSLPPPYGKPRTFSFLSGKRLSRAEAALNSHHIHRLAKTRENTGGCAGGSDVKITIVKHDFTRVTMNGYQCGNTTFGNIGGDLPGFLSAMGISLP